MPKVTKKTTKAQATKSQTSGKHVYRVEELRGVRVVKNKTFYLVKWKDEPARDATWEPEANILDRSLIAAFQKDKDRRKSRCELKKDVFPVEKLIGRKIQGDKTLFLVKWVGMTMAECTWEPASHILDKSLIKEYTGPTTVMASPSDSPAKKKPVKAAKAAMPTFAFGAGFGSFGSPAGPTFGSAAESSEFVEGQPISRGVRHPVCWQYLLDNCVDGKRPGWHDYTPEASDTVEDAYQDWQSNPGIDVRAVTSGSFQYMVDFNGMTQTNVTHSAHRVRTIRRVLV